MLRLLLLMACCLRAQEVSIKCTDRGEIQTGVVRGPDGLSAALKVWSDDDHMHAHLCMAGYELVVEGSGKSAGKVAEFKQPTGWPTSFMLSEGDWDRTLSVRLDGFSRDGKRVFGTFSEKGDYPFAMLFYREVATAKTETVDLKDLAKLDGNCGAGVAVLGTTETGAMVLGSTAETCRSSHYWQLDPAPFGPGILGLGEEHPDADGRLKPLPPGTRIIPLYRESQP